MRQIRLENEGHEIRVCEKKGHNFAMEKISFWESTKFAKTNWKEQENRMFL